MTTIVNPSLSYELDDTIVQTISWSLNVSPKRLYSYTSLREDLLLDTVDVTLLIATLESRLNLFLTEEEAARVETIGDFQRYFRARTAA